MNILKNLDIKRRKPAASNIKARDMKKENFLMENTYCGEVSGKPFSSYFCSAFNNFSIVKESFTEILPNVEDKNKISMGRKTHQSGNWWKMKGKLREFYVLFFILHCRKSHWGFHFPFHISFVKKKKILIRFSHFIFLFIFFPEFLHLIMRRVYGLGKSRKW